MQRGRQMPARRARPAARRGARTEASNLRPTPRATAPPDCCNVAGRSMASRCPSCSSATRPQRSASSRYGVAMMIVRPCARNSDSSFQNSRRDTGSTPVVGSSSSSTCGCVHQRARQRQLLLHPSGQQVGTARAERRELGHVEEPVTRRAVALHAVDLGEEADVLVDGQVAVKREPLRQITDIRGDGAMLLHRVTAKHRCAPRRTRS